jgi:putative transposase
MKTIKAIKLQLVGDGSSFLSLDGQSKICNWLYNHLLDRANGLKADFKSTGNSDTAKIVYTNRGLRNLVPSIKKEHVFLKSVHSSPLKNTALRLTSSIQAHQKSKKGKRKGTSEWPKFRSWSAGWFSLFYDEPTKGFRVDDDVLHISLGQDESSKRVSLQFRLKEARLLKGHSIRNMRIVCENGTYFAIFSVYVVLPETKPIHRIIALDPNHKNFAYGVDSSNTGIEIASPTWLKKYDKRIDELKGKRDRCQKKAKKVIVKASDGTPTKEYFVPSRRWEKRQKTLGRALHKRREQTKTFMFTLAHSLCQKYDCIAIGDYAPHGNGVTTAMRRSMNNRSLIGRFKEVLLWTAKKSGKVCVEFDEKGTTSTCHACRYVHDKGLSPSIRRWTCPVCQTEHIRDENAAINGLRRVVRDLSQEYGTNVPIVPCSGLVSIEERWAWRVLPRGMVIHPAGERTASNRSARKLIQERGCSWPKLDH